ncbi:MAG TPA: hypothetical protein VK430_09405 [Xanthobacteraceae bacterium]|nr:hypothetical protein [Xanthobacteraceae bacterium]
MGDDEFRNYVPLLRRIIILVAVLTAVPVMLWTITAFVRSYVGPPKTPTFRPLAATVSVEAPASQMADAGTATVSAGQQARLFDAASPMEAKAAASDSAIPPPPAMAKGAFLSDRPPSDAGRPASAAMIRSAALATPMGTDARAANQASPPAASQISPPAATSDGVAASAGASGEQQAALREPADILPAAEPLGDAVPLPRQRPHYFVFAQNGVPMPRPRPEGSGPSAGEATPGPLDWLQKLFQPQPQQQ